MYNINLCMYSKIYDVFMYPFKIISTFQSRKNWEHHQRMEGPSSSSVEGFCSSPKLLAVAGYLCPKTLSVFSSFESCEASIQKGTTGVIKFPFKGFFG